MRKVKIEFIGDFDGERTFDLDMTDEEFNGAKKIAEAFYDHSIGNTSEIFCLLFRAYDPVEVQEKLELEEKRQREEKERKRKEAARRREEERKKEILEYGPMAVAFKKALKKE